MGIKFDSLISPGVFSYYIYVICVIFAMLAEYLKNQNSS